MSVTQAGSTRASALHPDRTGLRPPHTESAPLGRQHDDRSGGAAPDPGVPLRRLQETARGHLDGWRGAAAIDPGIRVIGGGVSFPDCLTRLCFRLPASVWPL